MKIRVKCGSGRPAVVLQTSPEALLSSLKLQIVNRGLASDTCELSLNGKEALNEESTILELGIVSGDLVYLVHREDCRGGREGEGGRSAASSVMSVETYSHRVAKEHSVLSEEHTNVSSASSHHGTCGPQQSTNISAVAASGISCEGGRVSKPEATQLQSVQNESTDISGSRDTSEVSMNSDTIEPPEGMSSDLGLQSTEVAGYSSHFDELLHGDLPTICSRELATAEVGEDTSGSNLKLTPASILCIALHRLMLDTGYIPREGGGRLATSSSRWSYSTAISEGVRVHLACVKMGPLLTTHATATVTEKERSPQSLSLSLNLPLSHYTRTRGGLARPGLQCALCRATELAQVFKDSVAHKLLTEIRKVLGLPEVGTFSSLFPELKLLVCRLLDVQSLIAVSAVDKELNVLCQDPYLWRYLLLRDYGKTSSSVSMQERSDSWKQLYIQQHRARRERQRGRERLFEMITRDRHPIFPPVPLPPFPGVLGGDYDLFPNQLDPLPRVLVDRRDHVIPPGLPGPRPRRALPGGRDTAFMRRFGGSGFM